jgi:hydroxymethylbilane synthase
MTSFKIGTRGSKLALVQAHMVRDALASAHKNLPVEIVEIKTSGDWKPEQGETRLEENKGGKGQFAKEIEQALMAGAIDCGVHSMKDMESFPPAELSFAAMLPREDARDALLGAASIKDIKQGATIGSASVRRGALLLAQRPDLKIVPLRGNVPTRIEKLKAGQVDATLLALAGLKRLGLTDEIGAVLSYDEMLPAAGQGAVGIQIRRADKKTDALVGPLNHLPTYLCVTAERAVLAALDGSCHTPISAYAEMNGQEMFLRGLVAGAGGRQVIREEARAQITGGKAAHDLGAQLGAKLREKLPEGFLA